MRPLLLLPVIALAAFAQPALAAPFCSGGGAGISFEFGVEFGDPMTEMEENEFYLMQLRRIGVDATMVRQWNGCLQAFVRKPGGGETMEYYDPDTLERVY